MPDDNPILIENKCGKGVVSFIPTIKYPAASELRWFYTYIMKVIFNASHKNCDVQVVACDKIKFNVYDAGAGKRKIYLLNTDYSLKNTAIIKIRVILLRLHQTLIMLYGRILKND